MLVDLEFLFDFVAFECVGIPHLLTTKDKMPSVQGLHHPFLSFIGMLHFTLP